MKEGGHEPKNAGSHSRLERKQILPWKLQKETQHTATLILAQGDISDF